MQVLCQCESISFYTPTTEPIAVYHCHCIQCQKQTSSAFGTSAVFPAEGIFPLSPELKGRLGVWTRPANDGRTMDCYFCPVCGSRVMHRIREADGTERETVSIKGGLVQGLDWSQAIHIYTRYAVVDIPKGVRSFEDAPDKIPGRRDSSEDEDAPPAVRERRDSTTE